MDPSKKRISNKNKVKEEEMWTAMYAKQKGPCIKKYVNHIYQQMRSWGIQCYMPNTDVITGI